MRYAILSLLLVSAASICQAQDAGDKGRKFRLSLRTGSIKFMSKHAFSKYSEEVLNETSSPSGMVSGFRFTFLFNPQSILKPVLGLGLGILSYTGRASRGYQDGREIEIKNEGGYVEAGFRLGVRPVLPWVLLFAEIGNGISPMDTVTVSTPHGSRTFEDASQDSPFLFLFSLGASVEWKFLLAELSYTTGFDEMILASFGCAL